ncbi:hypothetical protein AKJ37_02975 [candidate division MSBL1 archaeon SCGC-AAA259I09]|uniref:Adenine DNA glycosylase n=1 Tax=candidate division MSBL1 archaeon SCGC-AAA259I09 TaxID=1698267 RepID=A0A133UT81_9EURY|nr:hypothetical protein AKJ37_02975 [candidate division MSBL1 archaeon SCGC-AAA259I09]
MFMAQGSERDSAIKSEFVEKIIGWYEENGRHRFPWRNTEDPYEILTAEFLLQKTTAEQVEEVYPKFLEAFPEVGDLAEAPKEEILDIIGGLGLAYRADRMKEVAQEISDDYKGRVPEGLDELLNLKGVGDYTANSVLCYAFGRARPVIDTNAGRILKRVFGLNVGGRLRQSDDLWSLAEDLVPENEPKKYNLGLLDLGAFVCHKKEPECKKCPVKDLCCSSRAGEEYGVRDL